MNFRHTFVLLSCLIGIVYYFVHTEDIANRTKNIKSTTYKVKKWMVTEIPIQIHIDQSVNIYFKKRSMNVKNALKQILNQTEILLQSSSLQQKIKLKLMSQNFTINNKNAVEMISHGSTYLKKYCKYEAKIKIKNNSSYYSVMLTALDLYYEINGIKNWRTTGKTYNNGICKISKSCAIIKWSSKNTAYLLVHEIAHSMGINHDGNPFNKCSPTGYIMNRLYNPRNLPRLWSKCSHRDIKKKLMNKKTRCLRRYIEHYLV